MNAYKPNDNAAKAIRAITTMTINNDFEMFILFLSRDTAF